MAKSATYTIEGCQIEFRAQTLETSFPIGENDMTEEDSKQTNERVRYASTAEHFRRANLDNKNARWIVFLETGHDKRGFRSMAPYLMRNCDGKPYILFGSAYLDSYSCAPCDPFGYDSDIWHALQNGSAAMLSDQGKAELLYACKTEQKRLEKRINAYLKRYGTSKIHVWTYWTEA